MNVLIPLLARRTLPPTEEELSLDRVVSDLTIRPQQAEPGTLCLLAYDPRTWSAFTRRARRVDRPPASVRAVALAGFARGDYYVVVPEPPVPEPVLALWRIGDEETLQVGIAEVSPADTGTRQVTEALKQGPESFAQLGRPRSVPEPEEQLAVREPGV